MNFNETSPTLNCGNILPQFLQEKVINLKIGEKTYNQGWGNLTIGRSHFNDVIIKDKSVSAFHANLEVCSRGIFITDHNSTNFTYINNVQIPARERMAVCQGSSQSSVKFGEVFCIIEFQHPTNLPATPERVRHTSNSPKKLNDSVILLDENKEVNNDHAADHHHESREEIDLSSSGVDIENNNDNDNETEETRSKSLNCPQASVDCRRYHDNEDDNKDRVINIIHSLSQNLQINQSNNKDNNDQKEYDGNDDNRLNNEDDDDDDDDDHNNNNNNNEDDDHHNNNEGDDHHKNNNEDDDNNDNKTEAEEEISTRSLVRPQTSVNYRRHHDNEGNRVKKITHRLFVCREINPSDDESNSDEEEDDNGNDDEDKNYKEEDDNGNNNEDNSDNEDDNGNDNDDTDTNDNITEEEIGSTSSTRTQVSVNHRSYHDNRDQRVLHIVHNVSISLQVSQSNDDNEDDTDNNGDDDEDDVDNNGNGDNDNHKCDEDDGDNNDNNDETYDPDVDEDDSTDDNDSNINDDNDGVHDKSKDSKSESKTKRRYNLRKNTRKYYPK